MPSNPYHSLFTGMYWLDPNGGSKEDAIFVQCNYRVSEIETCLFPLEEKYPLRNWVHRGKDKFRWFVADILTSHNEKVIF